MMRTIPNFSEAEKAYFEAAGEAKVYASKVAVLYRKLGKPVSVFDVLIRDSAKPVLLSPEKVDEVEAYLDYACGANMEGLNRQRLPDGSIVYTADLHDMRKKFFPFPKRSEREKSFERTAREAVRAESWLSLGLTARI